MRPNAKSFEEMDTKWYQYTALSFPADYPIDTWDNTHTGSEKVIEQWNKSGENPNDLKGCKQVVYSNTVKKG
ncbi:hypothetical protein [Phnomibacter ginsenosidimutans]|uniref:Uncharacterized protein n=1 Tax=Phnomibacter ginsenosidimutans TaxID=2676868 RepID=A0A6I6GIX7_9BACT|nr:hypothetical protein [Phnomibacter ginsenosidimutans]QGW26842.1 hypothetical protein GLV81_00865 [Phnomibacter ginsenosidimutans]